MAEKVNKCQYIEMTLVPKDPSQKRVKITNKRHNLPEKIIYKWFMIHLYTVGQYGLHIGRLHLHEHWVSYMRKHLGKINILINV